jgi:translocation and assembly module TamB
MRLRQIGRILLRVIAAVAVVLVIAALAAFAVLQSGWFHEYIRGRIIAEIERATGGRVELGRFSFRGATLTAQVSPLVLHGKEAAGDPPLLRIESVALGLRLISITERKVDLASLLVQQPQIRVVTYPDGSTNLPNPREHADQRNWAEQLIDLAIRRYEIKDGLLEYDDRKIPLNLQGEGLQVRMNYDQQTPSYRAELNSTHVRILPAGLAPVEMGLAAQFAIERSRIAFSQLRLSTKESRADLTGELRDLQEPRGSFRVKANAVLREAVKMFPIPLEPAGSVSFDGSLNVSFGESFTFGVSGRVNARGIGYAKDRVKVEQADVRADLHLGPDELALTSIEANALGAHFKGSASLEHWVAVRVDGTLDALTVSQAASMVTDRRVPWDGILAGDVSLSATAGQTNARAHVNLAVSPVSNGPTVTGLINGAFDQATGDLSLESSYLATPATRLDVAGTLDKSVQIQFRSTNLDDVLPALAVLEAQAPREIPLKLNNGMATASGNVTGRLENPRFQGQATVTNGSMEGHAFDKFTADLIADRNSIAASRFTLARGATEANGSTSIAARNGSFDDATVSGQATVRNVNLAELAKEAGSTIDMMGTAAATLRVFGSMRAPQADAVLDVQKPAAFGEQLDRLHATLHITPEAADVSGGDAEDGPGRLRFSGNYRHAGNDWRSGEAQLQLAAQNLPATRVEALTKMAPRFDARLNADLQGRARISNGTFALTSVDGKLSAQNITLDKEPLGEIALTGSSSGADISVTASGILRDVAFNGQGAWKWEGDEPGSANVRFNRMTVEQLHRLALLAGGNAKGEQADLPFEGFVEGHANVSVALLRPQDFRGEVTLDTVQLNPKPTQMLQLGVQIQDLLVRNSQPVVVALDSREARIRSAQLIARDTNIEATGAVPFGAGAGVDLSLRGSVNLIILQLLNPNLLAQGNASVQASVRGTLTDPSMNGRMDLKNASLYLNDLPYGVDNANGAVVFDRNRATIEKLTAETGGGTVSFGGFLGFGQVLTYRLQADVQRVRVRYPEAVSNIFSARLALNGTSNASTLSGTLTVDRTAVNPNADLGQLFALAARPSAGTPAESSYLRGFQFDVRVEGAPNFEFSTSLTRDVEASVNLRLRGTPDRPVLLGVIDVNQGEVQVFGNRYTVDRGEIRFLNPVKIDPTFDVQLETRARGITVTVGFTGTAQKLNVTYASDPPLLQSEIIALLAVGRDPTTNPGLASAQTTDASSNFALAGAGLLSQAVSEQLSNRFQRFFGASKVKVDPTMTGVDNLPQARLTLEQQVSKDITFTYITNLNRTQEQIVRLEWNFDKNWSAVAVRDANGLFGVDFQYRKRFR